MSAGSSDERLLIRDVHSLIQSVVTLKLAHGRPLQRSQVGERIPRIDKRKLVDANSAHVGQPRYNRWRSARHERLSVVASVLGNLTVDRSQVAQCEPAGYRTGVWSRP